MNGAFTAFLTFQLVDKVTGNLNKINSGLSSAQQKWKKTGATMMAAGAGITAALATTINPAAQVEQYMATFKTIYKGNEALAKKTFQDVSKFAASTPFELPQVVEMALKLKAIGVENDKLNGKMKMLGDLAAASGKPLDQAVNAYAKLASGQKGVAVDMFRDLLISTKDWEKATGKAFTKAGQFKGTAEEMAKALPKILQSKGLTGMMDQQSKTFNGVASNLSDSFFQLRATIGKSLLSPLKSLMKGVISVMDSFKDWAKENPVLAGTLTKLVGVIGALAVPLGALLITMSVWKKMRFATNIMKLGNSFKYLKSPLAIVLGLAILVIANWNKFSPTMKSVAAGVLVAVSAFFALNKILTIVNITAMANPWIAAFVGLAVVAALIIQYWEEVKDFFSSIGRFFVRIGNWISGVFTGMWEGIKAGFRGFINFFIEGINILIRGFNLLTKPLSWVSKKLGMGALQISEIPMLAKGTNNFQGGLALVGEQGPELVSMPRGSKVHTNSQTRSLFSGSNGGGGQSQTVHIHNINISVESIEDIKDMQDFVKLLKKKGVSYA